MARAQPSITRVSSPTQSTWMPRCRRSLHILAWLNSSAAPTTNLSPKIEQADQKTDISDHADPQPPGREHPASVKRFPNNQIGSTPTPSTTGSPNFSTSEKAMPYRMVFNVDGGCRRNGRYDAIGAAACCLQKPYGYGYKYKTQVLDDYPVAPTNQRAEIIAITMALEWALERFDELNGYPRLRVTIKSDSRYAVNCMTDWVYTWVQNGWVNSRGREVVNRDLIERASDLDDRVRELGNVEYIWVPREDNVEADECCQQALDEEDVYY